MWFQLVSWFNHLLSQMRIEAHSRRLIRRLKIIIFRLLHRLFPHTATEAEVAQLHQELSTDAICNTNYVVLIISSCLIATFGLISNSTAVIIGAMLVAPLMLPLRGLAFSACEGDLKLFRRAIFSILGAVILGLFFLISYLACSIKFPSHLCSSGNL